MKGKLIKGALTVLFASVLSVVGIFASDALQGIDSGIKNLANVGSSNMCPQGMVPIKGNTNVICVDAYEASASEACPNKKPSNIIESEKNANTKECYAASIKGAVPWTFISLPQAQRMCAGAGKRLPTSDEWYQIALGTDPSLCVIRSPHPQDTGTEECLSSVGVYDAVGNVWEWVNETVQGNEWAGRTLPDTGYVASVDAAGIAITTDGAPQELYGADYFWSKQDGVFGMLRGGFFGSENDAGLYTVNASVPTDFASQGVGFRCVEDVL